MSDDAKRGLYGKYRVERKDGSSGAGGKHERCEYFVLDLVHDKYAFDALKAYAAACREEFPALASDLTRRMAGERTDELAMAGQMPSAAPGLDPAQCATCAAFVARNAPPGPKVEMKNECWDSAKLKMQQLEREIQTCAATPVQKSNMLHSHSKLCMFACDAWDQEVIRPTQRKSDQQHALAADSSGETDDPREAERVLAERGATARFWVNEDGSVWVEAKIGDTCIVGESVADVADHITRGRSAGPFTRKAGGP